MAGVVIKRWHRDYEVRPKKSGFRFFLMGEINSSGNDIRTDGWSQLVQHDATVSVPLLVCNDALVIDSAPQVGSFWLEFGVAVRVYVDAVGASENVIV